MRLVLADGRYAGMSTQQNTSSHEFHRRSHDALQRALGAAILAALADDRVVEIMLNPAGDLWTDSHCGGMQCIGAIDRVRAMAIVATVAAMLGTTVTADSPILECELPLDGSRFEALIPPVVPAPTFALRKKASMIFGLDHYVRTGVMTAQQAAVIKTAVADKKNILIAGGTGSGKTTLANAVLNEISLISPNHRLVIIEDVLELQCSVRNTVFLRTSPHVDQFSLLRATLRLRPDRIIVGEVRDKSALALLKAWNTGHPGGIGTVHANSTGAALIRIGQLIQEAGVPAAPELISEAVNIVVSIHRNSTGRIIDEVAEVTHWSSAVGFELRRLG
jgi:P-type conjugative transfer ATPase TrbB